MRHSGLTVALHRVRSSLTGRDGGLQCSHGTFQVMSVKLDTPSLAKTTRPSLAAVLARDRLFALLDERNRAPVVWVWGPPGSGKTTLIASYLEGRGIESCWYQLDAGDRDVATFFYYMGRAGGRGEQGAGEALPSFTTEYRRDLSAFARHYFQELYARLEKPFILVLDNYHDVAPESEFHQVMPDAVAELPADGSIMVVSRTQPPPAMARLRAEQALQLVGWKDLRLTLEETQAIVRLFGADLDQGALEQIYTKTQGWPAGLILMLDQVMADGGLSELPDTSAPQVIFDYLAGEVFQKLDDATRRVLLSTAYLPDITERMASAISDEPTAGDILARLHRGNYYVTLKTGGTGAVYQYHPLLQEFLRNRVVGTLDDDAGLRLRRASAALLEERGNVDEAAVLLYRDEDWIELERLLLAHAGEMLEHGRSDTLERWLDEFPEEIIDKAPWLQYWRAACRFLTSPRESRLLYVKTLELFERHAPEDTKGLLLTCSGAMDAIIYELDDFSLLDRWIEETTRIFDASPVIPWSEVEARITVSLFIALVFRQPHHPDMKLWADRALNASQSLTDTMSRMSAQLLIAINLNYTGQFTRVREMMADMRQLCDSPGVAPLALTVLKSIESMHYMLTADRDRCLEAVYEGIEIADASGVDVWKTYLLSNGVGGALGAGDLESAEALLETMRAKLGEAGRLDRCNYYYYSSWLAMLREQPVDAYQELKTALRFARETGCPFYVILCHLAMAQVHIELGDEQRAASHLRKVHEGAREIRNRLLEFMALLGYADIALEHGRERSGLNSLRYAMGVGRENGFTHFPWWQPTMMARLCTRALQEGIEVDYVKGLIRHRALIPDEPPVEVEEWPWPYRIRSFGDFEVVKEGKPLDSSPKLLGKPLELLKALIGFGGDNVRELTLAQAIWPKIDGDYSLRSLSQTLHRLRRILGEDKAITVRNSRLTLDPQTCWLDTRAFAQVTAEIDRLARAGREPPSAATVAVLADKLLELYRGPFMAGEGDDPLYSAMRERLRSKFVRSIGDLARCFEEHGLQERAVECYRRSLEADTHAETFYCKLMLSYRDLGRLAEAVEVYNACKRTLSAELSLEPSRETTVIYESILRDL